MDTYRAIIAIVLAFLVLLAYQYLFVAPEQKQDQTVVEKTVEPPQPGASGQAEKPTVTPAPAAVVPAAEQSNQFEQPTSLPPQNGREIVVETNKYRAVISETGGGIKSFQLKNYRETIKPDSTLKELINTSGYSNLPLFFSWGVEPTRAQIPLFVADKESLQVTKGEGQTLTMTAQLSSGLQITKRMTFTPDDYLINMSFDVANLSENSLQGSPYLSLANAPFGATSQRYLFSGPGVLPAHREEA